MNYTDIYFEIIAEGGISLNPKDFSKPTTGYMVGKTDLDKKFKIGDGDCNSLIKEYLQLAKDNNCYFGAWFKKDTDEIVFDLSENIQDKEEALAKGILNNQEAIHDVVKQEDIFLPKGQGTGTDAQKRTYARRRAKEVIEALGVLILLILFEYCVR